MKCLHCFPYCKHEPDLTMRERKDKAISSLIAWNLKEENRVKMIAPSLENPLHRTWGKQKLTYDDVMQRQKAYQKMYYQLKKKKKGK